MSGGLMSCVRENSPPLDMEDSGSTVSSLPPGTPGLLILIVFTLYNRLYTIQVCCYHYRYFHDQKRK